MRLLACLLVALATAAAASADVGAPQVTANWAGYAISAPEGAAPTTFRDVTGGWTQPRATCAPGAPTAAAFWVGIGGLERTTTMQQIGTEADCDARGRATYRAWFAVGATGRIAVPLRVRAGDRLVGAVVVDGRRVTLSLKNVTHGTTFSKRITASRAPDVHSAEWITEAPRGEVALTDFGTVAFSRAAAIGNGHAGTIVDPAWQATPLALDSRSATVVGRFRPSRRLALFGGLPSGLADDGSGFAVAVQVTEG